MIKISKLQKISKNKITLDELEKLYKVNNYNELYQIVINLVENKKIKIIKSSKTNGKNPALYNRYTIVREENDYSKYIEELDYKIIPKLDVAYYRRNIERYKEDRKYILLLNDFLKNYEELLEIRISQKERSFQIWQEEKYLQKEGMTLLKRLGIDKAELNYYDTNEPLAYYSVTNNVPQNIVIIENMDTFYTMRRYLMEKGTNILGVEVATVIYGRGKGIAKAFNDFELVVDKNISNKENTILYFGDIDYEGIGIYEGLYDLIKKQYNIKPFVKAYEKIIDKALNSKIKLPNTKEKQNKNIKNQFMKHFNKKYEREILDILESGLYIPQEILNIGDL